MNSPKYVKSARHILIIVWFVPWCSKSQFVIAVIIANTYLGSIKSSQCFIYINSFNSHSHLRRRYCYYSCFTSEKLRYRQIGLTSRHEKCPPPPTSSCVPVPSIACHSCSAVPCLGVGRVSVCVSGSASECLWPGCQGAQLRPARLPSSSLCSPPRRSPQSPPGAPSSTKAPSRATALGSSAFKDLVTSICPLEV